MRDVINQRRGKMVEPPKKKQKRFATPADNEEMEKICQAYVPPNTRKSTNWALTVFEQWRDERNADVVEEERILFDLLECPQTEALNFWLSRFVVEARRQDGKPYPGSTLLNLLSGLYCHSKSHDADCPNFMDRKSSQFKDLNGALTVKFRELRQEGVGAVVKHATIVTSSKEDTLWTSNVIGDHTPLALQRAVFFYVGKAFCLRGGQEQRNLKRSQFVRSVDPDCYIYCEFGSKNHSDQNPRDSNKIVPIYANPSARPRCLVYLLDLYFSKFPDSSKLKAKDDIFYLCPVSKNP